MFVATDGNEIVGVTQDAAQLGGSQTYKGNGAWVVYGSGTDIWGTSDQFRYVYRAQAGDATLATHVDFQANTNIFVKAGLMVRASNAANAPYYDVVVDAPNAVIAVQYRDTAANQVVIAGGIPAYSATYDAAGNMTCRVVGVSTTCSGMPTGAILGWDNEGRLVAWQDAPTNPTSTDQYLYDGEGNYCMSETA